MEYDRRKAIYAYGKLCELVCVLATHPGEIRARLAAGLVHLYPVTPDMLPPDMSHHMLWIRNELSKFKGSGKEGDYIATLRQIRNKTGCKIAERIVSLKSELYVYLH